MEDLEHLFIPGGLLVNNNGDYPRIFTVEQFTSAVREQVESGNLAEFEEREVWSRTEVFGKIAQRFSTYEARFTSHDPEPSSTGINSIQLMKMGNDWLVVSVIWNDQTETMRIPLKYLPNGG
ncbi:MAG: hypothetical protein MUC66_00805 [Methanolinea sp.]|nr:hypothetical protein [Methanolinea sp.]